MTRTEIKVLRDSSDEGLMFDLYSGQYESEIFRPLRIDWADLDGSAAPGDGSSVSVAGSKIYTCLSTHPNASAAFQVTITDARNGGVVRVYVHELAEDGHRIPWEAIRSPTGFMSLDSSVPVVRLAKDSQNRDLGALIDKTLRMVVVLGALHVNCEPEWKKLRDALSVWPYGLDVSVLTYDDALKEKINEQPEVPTTGGVAAPGTRIVRAELMPGDTTALVRSVSQKTPHICHFLCHGTADANGQLEIAHLGTLHGADPMYLTRVDLADAANSAWLVVLNACEGAAFAGAPDTAAQADAARRAATFCTSLIADGIPFVVGMRDKVAVNVLPLFTGRFYQDAIATIATKVATGRRQVLDLSRAFIGGQAAICAHFGNPATAASQHRDWTLPVFHTRKADFTIVTIDSQVVGSYGQAVMMLKEIADLKRASQKQTEAWVREEIGKRISKLEDQLGITPGV